MDYAADRTVFDYWIEAVSDRPTVQQLRDLPKDEFADRTSTTLANFRGLCMAHVSIKPGRQHPPHYHAEGPQTLYVLEGQGVIRIAEQDHELRPGAVVIIPANAPHFSTNTGATPLSYVQVLTPGD